MLSGIPQSSGVSVRKIKDIVDAAVTGASEQQIVKDEAQDSSIALLEVAQTAQQQLNVQLQNEIVLRRLISDSYSIGETDTAILNAVAAYRTVADSYSITGTDTAITTALVPYRTIADSYSIATADATFAPRNRLRSTGSVQDQIIVNNNDIQMKINNSILLFMELTQNTVYQPIRLSGAADTAPTADSVVSRQYVDDAVAGAGAVPTRILAVGQLYEALAQNTGVSVAYNAFNIATFQDVQIVLYQPVFVSGVATTIIDPMQLTTKQYVDALIATGVDLSNYYTKFQIDIMIGLVRKIISDNQLYQAEANDTDILISYDSVPIAKFEENKITLSAAVMVEGAGLSLFDPAQLVYKGYVDGLTQDTLALFLNYRTIVDSYSQAEVDALIAGVSGGGGGQADRILSGTNLLLMDNNRLACTVLGAERFSVEGGNIICRNPTRLVDNAALIVDNDQAVHKGWVTTNYYDKPYIDGLPFNASTVYSTTLQTPAAGTDYTIVHGLGTSLEDLIIEVTLEATSVDVDIPMVVGDRFKIQYDNYNGSTSQVGYGVAVKSSSVNSVIIATQVYATILTFFNNEPLPGINPGPQYSSMEWASVKMHIAISTRPSAVFQYVGPNGYIPSSIASANYTTSYDGDDLDIRGYNVSIKSATDQSVNLGGSDIVLHAEKNLAVGGNIYLWGENQVEILLQGTTSVHKFSIESSQSNPVRDLEFTLPTNVPGSGLFQFNDMNRFEMNYSTGGVFMHVDKLLDRMTVNGGIWCEILNEFGSSSYEYKEYGYYVNKETNPTFCDIKKGVPQCKGFEQYHPRVENLPRLVKYKFTKDFCRALGKSDSYIDAQETKEGWIWEDVHACYPELCTTVPDVNKQTGNAYERKVLNVKGLQLQLIDALIEKVARLEYAMSQVIGDSKMW